MVLVTVTISPTAAMMPPPYRSVSLSRNRERRGGAEAERLAVAQRAADAGYRGPCSLDRVQNCEGELALLDLHFRTASCSIPLLVFGDDPADVTFRRHTLETLFAG